jgi:Zn-dependent protease with chaperone function
MWIVGAVGAFGVFAVAFGLNQLVGRGFLRLLRPRPLPWPRALPRPEVATTLMLFDSAAPEAFSFALVRRGAALRPVRHEFILLSTGLRARLTPDETEAAVAHELGHLRGLDGRYLTFLRTLARMMRWDPIIGYLTSCLTRREEFGADAEAARLTGRPMALARALYKASSSPIGPSPRLGALGFLGTGGRRARSDTIDRIRRLVELSESGMFPEAPRGRA